MSRRAVCNCRKKFYTRMISLLSTRMLLKLVTGNGERGTGNGERGTGNGKRGTGNGERETGNGKRETGNGAPGTGHSERESGKECTAVTRLRIQHGGQRKRKINNLGKCEEVLRL